MIFPMMPTEAMILVTTSTSTVSLLIYESGSAKYRISYPLRVSSRSPLHADEKTISNFWATTAIDSYGLPPNTYRITPLDMVRLV
jgi:hypothetical protein